MLLGWVVTVACLASSVLGAEDGVRKKLVRRRKGGDWLEGEGEGASARNSAPVKRVFKRKIVRTGSGEAAVVRRKVAPHLLPEQQRLQHQPPPPLQLTNQSLPTFSSNNVIPHKPMDAKRCEGNQIKNSFRYFMYLHSSFVSLHDRLVQERPLPESERQQRHVSQLQRLRSEGRHQVGHMRQWLRDLLHKYENIYQRYSSTQRETISVAKTCGGVTNINGTFFQSPGYPSTFDRLQAIQPF